ncbi:AAA family ATPase [Agathobacter sp.]|uniref:AAA family ATPase n=1 Tax=Agathobacter sp. TaxID=2021311 RepID=UPI003AB426E6
MQNPFTTTFSKTPEYTYIHTEKTEEILESFIYDNPSESVYKITGVRGSGKTVILAKVEEELRTNESRYINWLVFDVNPARDILGQIAAMLVKAGFGSQDKKTTGIDEVSKSEEMVKFASEYGRWLRAGYPVYFVCTGLYENIQELSNVKNLTFFRRAATVKTEPLNMIRMTEMYKSKLDIDSDEAREMAKITKGYAYAFQELGVLCFKKKAGESLKDILPKLKAELFAYSYEKIWEEMTEMDRFLAGLLTDKEEYKREEVLKLMGEKSGSYSMYRDRLIKRGIIKTRQGYISLALPYFDEYIKEYC